MVSIAAGAADAGFGIEAAAAQHGLSFVPLASERYFLALRKDQTGDRDGAMDDWIALLNSAPPDAPWLPQVRGFVEQVAAERGVDISDRLNSPAG